jgi:hypothetical protein
LYSAPIGALSPTLEATFFALSEPKRRGILEGEHGVTHLRYRVRDGA